MPALRYLSATRQNLIRNVLSICSNPKNCHTQRMGSLWAGDLWAGDSAKPPHERGHLLGWFFCHKFWAKNVCGQKWLEFSITKKLCPGIIAHEPYFLERRSLCFLTSIAPTCGDSPQRHAEDSQCPVSKLGTRRLQLAISTLNVRQTYAGVPRPMTTTLHSLCRTGWMSATAGT